jgi:hypothetical protein
VSIRKPREQSLVKPCLDLLALRGVFAWRNNTGSVVATSNGRRRFVRFSTLGASDILGVLPSGRFITVELKSKTGKLTRAQRSFLDRVEAAGGLALVVRDLKELHAGLDEAFTRTGKTIDARKMAGDCQRTRE